jgi:hypothetical protein
VKSFDQIHVYACIQSLIVSSFGVVTMWRHELTLPVTIKAFSHNPGVSSVEMRALVELKTGKCGLKKEQGCTIEGER